LSHICIASYFGGLGDSLQFSTLPEMFSKTGKDVFVWDKAYFRNPEIKDLVWGCNPYIKGTAPGNWSAGDLPNLHKVLHNNCISNWEMLHGFEATNLAPKIYYEASHLKNYSDVVLVDFSSITVKYDQQKLKNKLDEIISAKYSSNNIAQVVFEKQINKNPTPAGRSNDRNFNYYKVCDEKQEVKNIFQYCDLLRSCKSLVTTFSGACSLGSAIIEQNPLLEITCLIPEKDYEESKARSTFIYENVKYVSI